MPLIILLYQWMPFATKAASGVKFFCFLTVLLTWSVPQLIKSDVRVKLAGLLGLMVFLALATGGVALLLHQQAAH